jgi:hypothetical protein
MHVPRCSPWAIAALMLTVRCASSPTGPGERLPAGSWGGDGIRMMVADDSARLEFDCAHATIDQPFTIDGRGRFDLAGRYTAERGGPITEEELPSRPARYRGAVSGDRLDLTIMLLQPDETLGTFTLIRGRTARIIKCL